MTCEFGPQPYMVALPGNNQDITDLDNINLSMANILRQHF